MHGPKKGDRLAVEAAHGGGFDHYQPAEPP